MNDAKQLDKNEGNVKPVQSKKKKFKLYLCVTIVMIIVIILSCLYLIIINAFNPTEAANLPCRNYENEATVVNVNGFDLWYKEKGVDKESPPIIVLHGGPGMSCNYFKDSFNFLEDDYRVIYYDQRGSGFSQIKPDLDYYTLNSLVTELEAIRKEIVDEDKVIIIGHSFGGLLAMKYVLDYEEHVDKIILISSVPAKEKSGSFDLSIILKHGIPPSDPEEANTWLIKALPDIFADSFYDKKNINLFEPGYASFATMIAISKSVEGYDYRENLKQIENEVLVLYGKAEIDDTSVESQHELHSLFQNSTIVKFDKSGHWCFLEEPEEFETTVSSFLEID